MNRFLAALHRPPSAADDASLLARFRTDRDEGAFAELVRRHGPVVWGVCHRALHSEADAEDAFQATFLVLVRRADRVASHPALGPWLHQVARLTARNLRRTNLRRAARFGAFPPDARGPDALPAADAPSDVDGALALLPEKLRVPVVLCHLQGLTRAEAAARLGCAEGTLSATLAEALRRLRKRFGRADAGAVLAIAGAFAVPAGVSLAAARAAVIYAGSSSSSSAAGVSPVAAGLSEGVIRMLKLKAWATAACAVLVAGAGIGLGVAAGTWKDPAAGPPADPVEELRERLRIEQGALQAQRVFVAEKEKQVPGLRGELARAVAAAEVKAPQRSDGLRLVVAGDINAEWGPRYAVTEPAGGKEHAFGVYNPPDLARLLGHLVCSTKATSLAVTIDEAVNEKIVKDTLDACAAGGVKTVAYVGPPIGAIPLAAGGQVGKLYTGPIDLSVWKVPPTKK